MLRAGASHGLRRIRIPAEPPTVMASCGTPTTFTATNSYTAGPTSCAVRPRSFAGVATNDHCFEHWPGAGT